LLATAFAAAPLFRRRSAGERHVLWATAILLAALVPVFSGIVPRWQPDFARHAAVVIPALPFLQFEPAVPDGVDTGDIVVHADSLVASDGIVRAVWAVWLGGMAVLLIFSVRAGWLLRTYRRRAEQVIDPRWHRALADVARRLGVRQSIQLLRAADDAVPVTWGLFRPCIVVPASASAWSGDRLRIVLAHEVAHIRRHDWIVQLAAKAVCVVYWFNPLFWMASNRLHQESEQACDDLALGLGVDRFDYAMHLLEIAREQTSGRIIPALGMAKASTVERRFAALLDPSGLRGTHRRVMFAIAAGVFLLTLPLAAVDVPGLRTTVRLRTGGLPAIPETADASRDASIVQAIRNVRTGDGPPARGDVVPPEVIEYSTPPLYSDEARARKLEGIVTLDVPVAATGTAGIARVIRGLGFGLDDNARLAVSHWKFTPAKRNDVPLDSIATIDIGFSLANDALNELIANDMATRVGPGVTPPRIVRRVPVANIRPAGSGTRSGPVVLDVVLREDGTPRVVRIIRSLESDLDREAIRAFEQWRFSPAMKSGVPVKVRLNAEVTFQ
ncbi:MAG TPA: M56 family metallopeptidase, partial [Vicinamibacterales bacterium]|nr:M56 family metallopeptidase [Vicinamibacterales bacterium]